MQVVVVLGAVLGTIIYRISVVTVIYGSGEQFLKQHAKIFTSITAAVINLVIIMILTKASSGCKSMSIHVCMCLSMYVCAVTLITMNILCMHTNISYGFTLELQCTTELNWILPGLDFLIHNYSAGPEILFSMEYKIHIYMHKV